MNGQWNFETRINTETTIKAFANKTFVTGNQEGNVAAALFDIVDSKKETGDDLQQKIADVWKAATLDGKPLVRNMDGFVSNWNSLNLPSLDNVLVLNTIKDKKTDPPPKPEIPTLVTQHSEDFQGDLSYWTLAGDDGSWVLISPHSPLSGQPSGNRVASASDCDDRCYLTFKPSLDTTRLAKIAFDRFIDSRVDKGEGLYVQYSVDSGKTWGMLASYTESNGQDRNRWESTSLSLDVSYDTAMLRFVADTSSSSEIVEIDNLNITTTAKKTDPPSKDNTGPSISITSPRDGQTITSATVTVSGTASDPSGVKRITVSMPGSSAGVFDASTSFSHTFGGLTAGSKTITVTAWDNKNNRSIHTVTVTVQASDVVPPTITAPADITVEATGPQTIVALGTQTVSDNVDPNPKVTNNAPVSFALGTTTITWTATDASGNRATDTQRVTVRDTTPPTFSGAPSDITITVASHLDSSAVTFGTPTASDLVDGAVVVKASHASGSQFPVGTTTVTFTASDKSSNTARHSITIMIIRDRALDTTPPVIAAPVDITSEAAGKLTVIPALGTPTVSDDVDSNPKVTNNAPASFSLGTTTITWTATDASGNRATDTQRVTVQDTTPPTLTRVPADITAEIGGTGTYVSFLLPLASDLVDGTRQVTAVPPPGTWFAVGTHEVKFAAADLSGNTASAGMTITVRQTPDTTPPRITAPSDVTAEATGNLTKVRLGAPSVYDDRDRSPTVTNNAPSAFELGTTIVTWTATDDAGNRATDTQRVTVRDTTPPAFANMPADITKYVDLPQAISEDYGVPVTFDAPTAADLVDGPVQVSGLHESGVEFRPGSTTITWNATDSAGNTATATTTINIYSNIRKQTLNLINDKFDGGLDGWAYTEKPYARYNQIFCGPVAEFHNYNITHSTAHGGSMHLSESDTDACWLGTAGPVKRFTMPPTHREGATSVYLEYRSLADLSNNTRGLYANTALVMITDADYKVIKHQRLYNAPQEDSGWLNKTIQLGPLGKKCPCEIFVYALDAWWDGPWHHQLYVDNLRVTVSPPPVPGEGASGASSSASEAAWRGALHKNDLLDILSHAGARIVISDVQISSNAMTLQWEPHTADGADDSGKKTTYRIVLHPAGNSADKTSVLTADTHYRFDGLETGTDYTLRVRVAGDHGTQSALDVRTADVQPH